MKLFLVFGFLLGYAAQEYCTCMLTKRSERYRISRCTQLYTSTWSIDIEEEQKGSHLMYIMEGGQHAAIERPKDAHSDNYHSMMPNLL